MSDRDEKIKTAINEGIDLAWHAPVDLARTPLYVEITDPPAPEEKPEMVLSDEHTKDKARIATLKVELAAKDKKLGEAQAKLAAVNGALKA